MTKEDVVKQFFWDFLENLGNIPDDETTDRCCAVACSFCAIGATV